MVEHFIPTQTNGSGYTSIDDGNSPVGDGFPVSVSASYCIPQCVRLIAVELLKHFGDEIKTISMHLSHRTCQIKPSSEW